MPTVEETESVAVIYLLGNRWMIDDVMPLVAGPDVLPYIGRRDSDAVFSREHSLDALSREAESVLRSTRRGVRLKPSVLA